MDSNHRRFLGRQIYSLLPLPLGKLTHKFVCPKQLNYICRASIVATHDDVIVGVDPVQYGPVDFVRNF